MAVCPISPTRARVVGLPGNGGVKKGMVFVIHRDDEYIGDLTVSAVDPNESAGRLKLTAVSPTL